MAALTRLVLTEIVSPENVVKWIKGKPVDEDVQKALEEYVSLKTDFVPEVLNILREFTLHILENGVAESPVKTPSQAKVPPKQEKPSERPSNGKARRSNLFSSDRKQYREGGSKGQANVQQDCATQGSGCHCKGVNPHSHTGCTLSEQHKTRNTRCEEVLGSKHSESMRTSEKSDNLRVQSNSFLSCTSSLDDSILAGSTDTSSYSYNGSEFKSKDSLHVTSTSASSLLSTPHGDNSNSFHSKRHPKNNNGKKGAHFQTPNAHSTPQRRRSNGRHTPSPGFSLGDFLVSDDQGHGPNSNKGDSTTDTSSDFSSVLEGGAGKGSKKKKKKQRNLQMQQNDANGNSSQKGSSSSVPKYSNDDFPPVSPSRAAVAVTGSTSSHLSQQTSTGSPVMAELRARVVVHSYSSVAAQPTVRPSPAAALDFTVDKAAKNPWSCSSSVAADQDNNPTKGQPSTWGKKDQKSFDATSSQDFPAFKTKHTQELRSSNSEKENVNAALNPWNKTLGMDYQSNNKVGPLGDKNLPCRLALTSVKTVDKKAANSLFSPKLSPGIEVSPWEVSNSGKKVPDSSEFSAVPGKDCDQNMKDSEQRETNTPPSSSLPGSCVSPVKEMRLQDSGDQFKSPPKAGVLWQNAADSTSFPCTPDKPSLKSLGRSMSIIKLVKASPLDVTHQTALDLFIRLYSACLDEHLFPNLSTELYFLTQLLIAQTSEDDLPDEEEDLSDEIEEKNLFQTVHNVVYFAVGVLERQSELLKQLDRSTLRLLSENERVGDFSPKLQQEMKAAFDDNEEHSNSSVHSASMAVVSFQAETNNRRNFPDDKSFHHFKRQRDTFFHVKKEWEKHASPGWTLEWACGGRIRAMFETPDLAASLHFARLFVSQLIMSCKNEEMISTKTGYKDISELISLKSANPDKFNKLHERLMKPASCGSPCPPVTFPGHQQFFYDFLVIANSAQFYSHVADIMVSRIGELNQMDFQGNQDNSRILSDQDTQQDQEDREEESAAFSSAMLTMRLLARFLGFLHHLSYSGIEKLPKHLQHDNIALRNKLAPSWDISGYVQKAANQGHLALTIPWVVEYLAMMDAAAPRTDHITKLLAQLRHLLSAVWAELKESGFTYSRLLVVTTLGWLFDQPCMPVGHFFTEPQVDQDNPEAISVALEAKECSDLVSQDLFYSCCPYFGEMRYLLTEHSLGSRAKTEVRKVNPRPPAPMATIPKASFTSTNSSIKSTQSKLMQTFFHMNSKSMHRLVDFVADRISSNFIKNLRHEALPVALARCEGEGLAMGLVPEIAQRLYTETRNSMIRDMESQCMEDVKGSLQLLLPRTTHKTVVIAAVQMSCAMTAIKVNRWIKSHVEYDAFHNILAARVLQRPKSPTPHRNNGQSSSTTKAKTKPVDTSLTTTQLASAKGSNHIPFSGLSSLKSPSVSKNDAGKEKVASTSMAGGAESSLTPAVTDSSFCGTTSITVSRHEAASPTPDVKGVSSLDDGKKRVAWALPGGDVMENNSAMLASLSGSSPTQFSSLKSFQPLFTDHNFFSITTDRKDPVKSAENRSKVTSAGSVPGDSTSKTGSNELRAFLAESTLAPTVSPHNATTADRKPGLTCTPSPIMSHSLPTPAGDESVAIELSAAEDWSLLSAAECDHSNNLSHSGPGKLDVSGASALGVVDSGSSLVGQKAQAGEDDLMCYMLRDVQDLLWTLKLDVDLEEDPITPEEVCGQLQRFLHTLSVSSADEHASHTFPFLVQAVAQIAAAVVFCQPVLWTEESCNLLLELWAFVDDGSQELPFLCSRVILGYLHEACDLQLSLLLYGELLNALIQRNFFTLDQIQESLQQTMADFQMFGKEIQDIFTHLTDSSSNAAE